MRDSARVEQILARLPGIPVVEIDHYGALFNRSNQNFRLQKQSTALILASKHGNLVLPTPPGYGFENEKQEQGFYFSHMLNCIYDCRYCFLQGMFRSANTVLFVNYEDFEEAIVAEIGKSSPGTVFYSGYDCDSLALEPVSLFMQYILPLFERQSSALLEIRTKSTQVRSLLDRTALPNCVVAMSFSPAHQSEAYEHKVPSIDKRLDALLRLQQAGWPVALRFEPVIAESNSIEHYKLLFQHVFNKLDAAQLHSVSLGEYRMPSDFYKRIVKLYPDDQLLARETRNDAGMTVLATGQDGLIAELEELLLHFVDASRYYRCA